MYILILGTLTILQEMMKNKTKFMMSALKDFHFVAQLILILGIYIGVEKIMIKQWNITKKVQSSFPKFINVCVLNYLFSVLLFKII